ncbi:UPF0415 protein C7orf25 homolog isoform X1 [Amphibalanus amphitrite]|nr:UPF0415 protein C7orf25 homolog isoform X1 [Amphibalanus amphitrite]
MSAAYILLGLLPNKDENNFVTIPNTMRQVPTQVKSHPVSVMYPPTNLAGTTLSDTPLNFNSSSHMADTGVARLDAKVRQGQEILAQLKPLRHIEGCDKLARKVSAELKFLQKLQRKPHMLKEDHLRSSNMESLQAIADTLSAAEGAVAVLAAFTCPETGERVVVDVVAAGGAEWVKVISRNPAALQRVSLGQGEFGQRSTQEQAERYLAAADGNRHYFRPPTVRFVFSAGVGRRLAERLRARGVTVTGQCIDDEQLGVAADSDSDSGSDSSGDELEEEREETAPLDQEEGDNSDERVSATLGSLSPDSGLNLDVTAMLAYVSNLTNGHCHASFSEPVLSQQAAWERETPVKPALDRLFAGRQLVCCRSAERAFVSIVNTVGGPSEQARARLLLQRLQVVEDRTAPATALLAARGKVRGRSAAVFGTGEALRIPTVTANTGFVRAAAGQGVKLTALTHGSRALTEAKEHPAAEGGPAAEAGGTQPVEDEGSSSSDTSPPSSDVDESVPGSLDAVAPLSQPSPLPVF